MQDTPVRSLNVFLLTVVGLSLVGFVVGVGDNGTAGRAPLPQGRGEVGEPEPDDALPVRSYLELRDRPWGETEPGWRATRAALEADAGVIGKTGLTEALAARRERRAFDGAPPVIPHPIGQQEEPSCMACHEDALVLHSGHVASAVSHRDLKSCVQCHPATAPLMPLAADDPLRATAMFGANTFAGLESPSHGRRAHAVAPPEIPHSTVMRDNCLSCHGDKGAHPLRSSHPERQSCAQCHTASATLDQRELWDPRDGS
ncbi:MAG: hypothetical protein B7733_16930 [Myxococcales bacterium FL481]|nr:MAG: hypothetical protein B7733_16930 [Myxococcales bacterium FL481]